MIPVSQNSVVSNRKKLLRIIIWYYIVQTCTTVLHRCVHMYDFIQQTVTVPVHEFVWELQPAVCAFYMWLFQKHCYIQPLSQNCSTKKKKIILKNFISFKWASVPKLRVVGVGSLPETIILKKGKNCVHEQLFLTLLEQMCSVFSWLEQQGLALIITVGWVSTLKKY